MRSPYVGLNGIRSAVYLSQPPESQVLVDSAAVAAAAAHAQCHSTAALATSYRSLQCPTQAQSTATQSAQIRAVLPHVVSPPVDATLPSTQPDPRTAAWVLDGRWRRRLQPPIPHHTPRGAQNKPHVPMAFTRGWEPKRKFDNQASLRQYVPRSYRACQPCPRRLLQKKVPPPTCISLGKSHRMSPAARTFACDSDSTRRCDSSRCTPLRHPGLTPSKPHSANAPAAPPHVPQNPRTPTRPTRSQGTKRKFDHQASLRHHPLRRPSTRPPSCTQQVGRNG